MALSKVPCAYDYNVYMMGRFADGRMDIKPPIVDLMFLRRMKWIAACASASSIYIHHFDYLKSNQSRYFAEIHAIHVPKRMAWGWTTETYYLAKRPCYYLGTYPNYWNITNKRIVYPHNFWTADVFPMENEPVIPAGFGTPVTAEKVLKIISKGEPTNEFIPEGIKRDWEELEINWTEANLIDYLFPERMTVERRNDFMKKPDGMYWQVDKAIADLAFFHSKEAIIQWLRQSYALKERKHRYAMCIVKNYPKKMKEPQYKTPRGDWPGIPMKELEIPQPTQKPYVPIPPREKVIRLTVLFGILKFAEYNGFSLILNVEERRE